MNKSNSVEVKQKSTILHNILHNSWRVFFLKNNTRNNIVPTNLYKAKTRV